MPSRSPALRWIVQHPYRFARQVFKSFFANQGILLAGAVAYNTLLSIIPVFTLLLVGLSRVVDEARLLAISTQYLDQLLPGESAPVVAQLQSFLAHRELLSWVLVGMLLFFSSLAFSILENAMHAIFADRLAGRRRSFLTSVMLPYFFILLLGISLLAVTVIAGILQAVETLRIEWLGWSLPLHGFSRFMIYLLGLAGHILMLTLIYLVMPAGQLSLRLALIGGVTAGLLWELIRHVLTWYFANISMINVVYGSLATAVIALLSLEIAAIVLLLGAQVIAEYERLNKTLETAGQ
jgi:membrane protein